jgi:hypothetical protein
MSVTRRDFLATAAAGVAFATPGIGRAEQTDLMVNSEGKTYDSKPSLVSPSSEFVCPNRVVASPNRSTQMGHINWLGGDTPQVPTRS